jgi:Bacterial regulatory helix-turn-helix proteins, AraC family
MDTTLKHLGMAVLSAIQPSEPAPKIFLDYIGQAILAHATYVYGETPAPPRLIRGHLAPWQARRAKEFLNANLHGDACLASVAAECNLSVSYFAHAFRRTFGRPPHRWLMECRICDRSARSFSWPGSYCGGITGTQSSGDCCRNRIHRVQRDRLPGQRANTRARSKIKWFWNQVLQGFSWGERKPRTECNDPCPIADELPDDYHMVVVAVMPIWLRKCAGRKERKHYNY